MVLTERCHARYPSHHPWRFHTSNRFQLAISMNGSQRRVVAWALLMQVCNQPIKLVSETWQRVHCPQTASAATRSQSPREPLGRDGRLASFCSFSQRELRQNSESKRMSSSIVLWLTHSPNIWKITALRLGGHTNPWESCVREGIRHKNPQNQSLDPSAVVTPFESGSSWKRLEGKKGPKMAANLFVNS